MENADKFNRTLFIADNLPILRGIDSESVDLIATDPPFNKGVKAFEGIVTAGADRKGKKVSYKDVWTWGDVQTEWTENIKDDHPNLHSVIQAANAAAGEDMGAFLCWLAVRVLEMHRILKPTGSLYLHIDHTAGAYAKAMMDAIFGRNNFRNEIIWSYTGRLMVSRRGFNSKHDNVLFYAKSDSHVINPITEPVKRDEYVLMKKQKVHRDENGREWIWGHAGRGKSHNYRIYLDEVAAKGKAVSAEWTFPIINTSSKERVGFPTQKPLHCTSASSKHPAMRTIWYLTPLPDAPRPALPLSGLGVGG